MPPVIRDTGRDGYSGLSTSTTVGVCVASLVAALTLGGSSMLHGAAEIVVTDLRDLRPRNIRYARMGIYCTEKEQARTASPR
jgi:hypothetical protein